MDVSNHLELAEEVFDHELVFDDPVPEEKEEEAPAPAKPARKRRTRAAADAAPDEVAEFPELAEPLPLPAAPADFPFDDPITLPGAETAPALAGLPAPAPAAQPMPRWLIAALCVSVFASLLSAIGLIVADRAISKAAFAHEEAEQRAAAFHRLPKALAEVEALVQAERTLLARQRASAPAALVTADVLRRELDALRLAIANTEAPGTTALAGVVRQGQAELAGRIDTIQDRVDALSRQAATRAGHR